MIESEKIIRLYLLQLGISLHGARMYQTLLTYGEQTISELSRRANIERTRVYRELPKLDRANLIEIDREEKSVLVRAAPLHNVQILLSKREQQVSDLVALLPKFEKAAQVSQRNVYETAVRSYRGSDGIKQMLWNETKAKGELLSVLRYGIQIKTRAAFFDRWVAQCNARGLTSRSIVSSDFHTTQASWHAKHITNKLLNWQGRVVAPNVFPIEQNIIIHDDTVGFFNWGDDEIYGIEIKNQLNADTQRHFFELLWAQASSQKS
ncbi:MAG: helix-turn-helix domain-containing protein [Candidatus Saccharimonas sp.]